MATAPKERSIRILLVEDNPGDARLTQEALEEARIANDLDIVADGAQALEFVKRQGRYAHSARPDLILLDLNLPKMSGLEVLAEIKKDDRLRSIPVIILTTSRNHEEVNRAYFLNCNAYIVKPVSLEQFIEAIELIDRFWLTIVTLPEE